MSVWHFITLIPAMLGLAPGQSAPGRPDRVAQSQPRTVTTVTVQQTTIFRIPVRPHPPVPPTFEWREHKGPKCLPAGDIGGAMLAGSAAIDFVMRGGQRYRAKIDEDCTALDFYYGFYVQPQDERLCARRDEIRSRMGASCRIERFRSLVPSFTPVRRIRAFP